MAKPKTSTRKKPFHIEFLNSTQKMAYGGFQQHDILFLLGPAGTGKSYLSMAFAISEILNKKKKKIVLTRPIVESGESLGYLPGDFYEKVNPYMLPLYDCLDNMVGAKGGGREAIDNAIEIAPLAYMRGRTFQNAICIFDEAQNASKMQLKLFLSRLGDNSKMIINGDPHQSDIHSNEVPLVDVVARLENIKGISIVRFNGSDIVRHPLISKILEKL